MDTGSNPEGNTLNYNVTSLQTESLLLTDRYLLTMAYSWFKAGMHSQIAVYEWFYRKNPFNAPYAVFCGVSESVDYLRNKAKFFPDELAYIAEDLQLQESDPFIQYLQNLDFKHLEISFIAEGTIVFPYLPLISIKGSLIAVQLLETLLLNKLNYPTLIATNARLMKEEIGPDCSLLEFGLRRAQGPDGGTIGALYAYIGGASSTSNVLAGKRYGVPIIGTMAHSFVTSFSSLEDLKLQQKHRTSPNPAEQSRYIEECLKVQEELGIANQTNQGELAAFISFSWDFPNSFICLIDTYDTLKSGILNYATVAIVMERRGLVPKGIRLDSGDLAKLSLDVKQILKEIGLKTNTKIGENSKVAASDDLSLAKIKAMRGKNSIDMFAVGTRLITCAEQSALGMVCKLSWLDGTPRIKYSEVAEKSTLPDRKQVHRVVAKIGESQDPEEFEVLSLYEEELNGEQIVFAHQDYASQVKISILSSTKLLLDAGTEQGSLKLDVQKAKNHVDTEAKKYAHLVQHGLKRKLYISQNLKNLLFKLRQTHNQGE